jgi:rhodanese-related sulfurtransferase
MSSHHSTSSARLWNSLGISGAPVIIDVRDAGDFGADQRVIPTSRKVAHTDFQGLVTAAGGQPAVIVCQKGLKLSEGAAALLRANGTPAHSLEGGFLAWREAGYPLVPVAEMAPQSIVGGSLWVTRERPKIDRVACPWLIRRFIDPQARFLFVRPSEVIAVAEKFDATPFDVEGVRWSHDGPECTFDTMVRSFGLATPALDRLSRIVRGADTASPELAPECSGLLALSLGLSRLFNDDLEQIEAGLVLYDALYLWCRDAAGETHNWPAAKAAS